MASFLRSQALRLFVTNLAGHVAAEAARTRKERHISNSGGENDARLRQGRNSVHQNEDLMRLRKYLNDELVLITVEVRQGKRLLS